MGKLYFKYGAMGSSKTANALMAHFNYEEKGKNCLLVKSEVDTRDGEHMLRSRIGLQRECITLASLIKSVKSIDELKKYDCIIVDEAQFASKEQIDWLSDVVDQLDIPVMCYGLRTDFQSNFFPGSKRLMEIADTIEEIVTICWCGRKATCTARMDQEGHMIRSGAQVDLGANDKYVSVCRRHYKLGQLEKPNS